MTFVDFCLAVRQYGMMTGGSTTSWGRTTKRNQAVGGVPYSAHRFWLAVDLVYDEPVMPKNERIVIASRLGLKVIAEGSHDHCQPETWAPG